MWESRYDAFRDVRVSLDGLRRATASAYDKAGRLTTLTRPGVSYQVSPGVMASGALVEDYRYDGLGRRPVLTTGRTPAADRQWCGCPAVRRRSPGSR